MHEEAKYQFKSFQVTLPTERDAKAGIQWSSLAKFSKYVPPTHQMGINDNAAMFVYQKYFRGGIKDMYTKVTNFKGNYKFQL